MRAAYTELSRQLEQAAGTGRHAEERQAAFEHFAELTPNDLPEPRVPADLARLRACGVLFMTLDRWAAAGDNMPFTWVTLQEHTSLEAGVAVGAVALEIAKSVMGPAWAKMFGGRTLGWRRLWPARWPSPSTASSAV